jgi:hypothetical protein
MVSGSQYFKQLKLKSLASWHCAVMVWPSSALSVPSSRANGLAIALIWHSLAAVIRGRMKCDQLTKSSDFEHVAAWQVNVCRDISPKSGYACFLNEAPSNTPSSERYRRFKTVDSSSDLESKCLLRSSTKTGKSAGLTDREQCGRIIHSMHPSCDGWSMQTPELDAAQVLLFVSGYMHQLHLQTQLHRDIIPGPFHLKLTMDYQQWHTTVTKHDHDHL